MHKTSWIILILFSLFFAGDMFTTLQAGEFLPYLEANPIYPYVGLPGIILLNIFLLYFMLWSYHHAKPFVRFNVITAVLLLSTVRFTVIQSNAKVIEQIRTGELTMAAVQAIPEGAKYLHYMDTIAYSMLASLMFLWLVYFLFSLDHTIKRKDAE